MKACNFSLKPFPSAVIPSDIRIAGRIKRHSGKLAVEYELTGALAEIEIPEPADEPERMNGLWEKTCFEFFIGLKNSSRYWEFNLSPSGRWNVYSFSAYRQDMREEPAFTSLQLDVRRQPGSFQLSLECDLDSIIPADMAVNIGVSAVIKFINGGTTFWSLTHPGAQADFHRRDGFIIEL